MVADCVIRKARSGEQNALTELCMRSKQSNGYDAQFMESCAEELRVREEWITGSDFWVAETAQAEIIGCIRLSCDGRGSGELETCFVDPAWKGRGVGRLLFERLAERAGEYGLDRLGLDADPFAQPFYERMGFRTIGQSPSGSIPGRTLPRMELTLQERRMRDRPQEMKQVPE